MWAPCFASSSGPGNDAKVSPHYSAHTTVDRSVPTSRVPQGEDRAWSGGALSELPHPTDEDNVNAYLEEKNYPHPSATPSMPPLAMKSAKLTIHILPDDVLLGIFDLCRGSNEYCTQRVWRPLVHVCRRWRHIIFESPRHLHLLLVCDIRMPVKISLDTWPSLPIAILYSPHDKEGAENVIAAFERHSRISWIVFNKLTSPALEQFVHVMQKPLLALTGLHLQSFDEMAPVVPDAFLGGSAPELRSIFLEGVAFPALPRLAASAMHLTKLRLQRIPDTGYIEPEVMATCLTTLPKLEELHIGFQSPRSPPLRIRPPLPTRADLLALTYFVFRGDSTYLEDLIAQIRVPNLDSLNVWFFMDFIFVIPMLHNVISSAERLNQPKRAHLELYPWTVRIALGLPTSLEMGTRCDRLEERVSWMVRLCKALSLHLSHVECLEITGDADSQVELQDSMASMRWLDLFRSFTTVRGLYVSNELGPHVAHALQDLKGRRATEVLPSLRKLSLGGLKPYGSVEKAIEPFVAARRLSDHPVVVEPWEQDLLRTW